MLYYDNAPGKLEEDYQRLSAAFEKLGERHASGLDERIKQASLILRLPTNERTDEQWDMLGQLGKDLNAEIDRCNSLREQREKARVAQELSDLERRLTSDIPEGDRGEIISYFQLKRGEGYRDERFIAAVSAVERGYLLPLLKITQAHLSGKRAPTDWNGEDRLLETLPELFRTLPPMYKDRVIDILVTSAERGNGAVGIYMLARQIPKQFGIVQYDDSQFTEPKMVPDEHKDIYLETAKRLAEANSPFDTDILKNFPYLVTKYGVSETQRILGVALRIKDEDFPGWNNVVLFYINTKAGTNHVSDQQKFTHLVRQVEAKYQGPNLS